MLILYTTSMVFNCTWQEGSEKYFYSILPEAEVLTLLFINLFLFLLSCFA